MIPQKILSRKDVITADFMELCSKYITDLVNEQTEQRLHTSDFAAQLFIHPRHLTNTIKLTTGKSPCDHLEEGITAAAKELLASTDISVADIGYRFGYNDPTNFSKFFKSMTGITPLRFRKQSTAA